MKDISIFEGVVAFEAEGLTYNAIWKGTHWDMSTLDQQRVIEMHEVVLPRSATPKELIKAWWKEQQKAGTYTVPPDIDVTTRPGWQGKKHK